jgi:hypothetical protein
MALDRVGARQVLVLLDDDPAGVATSRQRVDDVRMAASPVPNSQNTPLLSISSRPSPRRDRER